jgi:two-component system, OmpR family, sensor histidine kinase TctE
MRDAVLRTGKVTNRLLALARAEQASPDPARFASVDLYAMAERVGEQWIARAIARDIDLGFELAPASLHGDDALLSEMLDNLIDNALRYTPPGGTVTVRCGVDAGGPWFGVEDNGIGIPETERAKVLERFYRGAGAGGEGSGLGLAIVKEGADRHGASVAISPPRNGIGTFVCVRFAAAAAASSASVEIPARAPAVGAQAMRVDA